jgi:hypothetical protein
MGLLTLLSPWVPYPRAMPFRRSKWEAGCPTEVGCPTFDGLLLRGYCASIVAVSQLLLLFGCHSERSEESLRRLVLQDAQEALLPLPLTSYTFCGTELRWEALPSNPAELLILQLSLDLALVFCECKLTRP